MAFAYLLGCSLQNPSGQPMPLPRHSHTEKVLPDVQREPPVFQLVPVDSGSVTGHHQREPGSIFFAPSLQVFLYINKIAPEPSLL